MSEKKVTPMRAIRAKCLECSNGSAHEATNCPVKECALYVYRSGKNPARAGKGGGGNTEGLRKYNSERAKRA